MEAKSLKDALNPARLTHFVQIYVEVEKKSSKGVVYKTRVPQMVRVYHTLYEWAKENTPSPQQIVEGGKMLGVIGFDNMADVRIKADKKYFVIEHLKDPRVKAL